MRSDDIQDPVVSARPEIGLRDLFGIFLRSGLTYGGGTTIAALLQRELVDRRRFIARSEFMELFGLARIVPTGSIAAIAVAYGHRFQRMRGTLVALAGMILPGWLLTVLLAAVYTELSGTRLMDIVDLTLAPATIAIVVISTLKLAEEFLRPSVELALAVTAFLLAAVFRVDPSLLLIAGGLAGALAIRGRPAA